MESVEIDKAIKKFFFEMYSITMFKDKQKLLWFCFTSNRIGHKWREQRLNIVLYMIGCCILNNVRLHPLVVILFCPAMARLIFLVTKQNTTTQPQSRISLLSLLFWSLCVVVGRCSGVCFGKMVSLYSPRLLAIGSGVAIFASAFWFCLTGNEVHQRNSDQNWARMDPDRQEY